MQIMSTNFICGDVHNVHVHCKHITMIGTKEIGTYLPFFCNIKHNLTLEGNIIQGNIMMTCI